MYEQCGLYDYCTCTTKNHPAEGEDYCCPVEKATGMEERTSTPAAVLSLRVEYRVLPISCDSILLAWGYCDCISKLYIAVIGLINILQAYRYNLCLFVAAF